ncbi:hypothetical protein GTP44_26475 [Duganella sp. FT50W]|uniref:Uncharacterized protein n=1 Tax=Duganella lactea TaxID=2692173 RepID=A0A6L8MTS3_9BURK|nr:hypothetical protein [Duganella lactea]MYM85462.1 hypothetical protein [Duganella lactea]
MQIGTILGIFGSSLALAGCVWRKQWVAALAMLFWLAYIVFDKVFPSILPEHLVTGFSFVFLALALIFCWQVYFRKRNI